MELDLFTLTEAKMTNLRGWGYGQMRAIPLGNTFSLQAHVPFLLVFSMKGVSKGNFGISF